MLLEAINLIFNSERLSKSASAICAPIVEDYLAKIFEAPRDTIMDDKIILEMEKEANANSVVLNTPEAKAYDKAVATIPRLDGFTPTPVLQ